jgi:hypothetical protein
MPTQMFLSGARIGGSADRLRAKHVEQGRIFRELAAEIDDAAVDHRAVAGAAVHAKACKAHGITHALRTDIAQTDAGAPGCRSGCARAKASFCMQVSTIRRTVGYGDRSTLKKLAPVAWVTRQMSAMVMASPWQ